MWIAALISAASGIGLTVYQTVSQRKAAEAQAAADKAAAEAQAEADQAAAQQAAAEAAAQLQTIESIAGTLGPVLSLWGGYQIGKQIRGKR